MDPSIEEVVVKYEAIAGEDLTGKQYHMVAVSLTVDNEVIKITSPGGYIAGVLLNRPRQGEVAHIAISGIVYVMVGMGGIGRGNIVASSNKGETGATAGGIPHHLMALESREEGTLAKCKLLSGLNKM